MAATANLRELHGLHQRAKALRDQLESLPKTVAARRAVLDSRKAALEAAQKALKEARAHIKNREVQLQSQQAKVDDLRTKLNAVKKQVEYDAIRNEIAHINSASSKLEDDILEAMTKVDEKAAAVSQMEAEFKGLSDEVAQMEADLGPKVEGFRAKLSELETGIAEAEEVIPIDQRDHYRRVIKQRKADALAAVEGSACTGCYLSVTAQSLNELINQNSLVFCKSCGRILYLAEDALADTRRSGR